MKLQPQICLAAADGDPCRFTKQVAERRERLSTVSDRYDRFEFVFEEFVGSLFTFHLLQKTNSEGLSHQLMTFLIKLAFINKVIIPPSVRVPSPIQFQLGN